MPNLETYLKREGAELPVSQSAADYKAGDIVTWRLGGRLPHIGIVSDKKSREGTPLIIHNVGAGPQEEDVLFIYELHRRYRFIPSSEP